MGVIYFFSGEMWLSGMILGMLLSLLLWILLFGRRENQDAQGLMAAAVMLLSSAFVDFSTSGLENSLSHLLAVLFAMQFLKERSDAKWLFWMAFLASMLMLCRLDLGLLAIPAMLAAWFRVKLPGKWRYVLLGLAPIVIWEIFSLCNYGFLLPNTWYAKLGTGDHRLFLLGRGLVYCWDTLRHDPVTGLAILLGIAGAFWKGNARHRWLLAGMLLYLLAVLFAGGDFMRGRMFSVAFALSIFLLMRLQLPRWTFLVGLVLLAAGLIRRDAPIFAGPNYHVGRTESPQVFYPDYITDERAMYWRKLGLWANHGQSIHPAKTIEAEADAARNGHRAEAYYQVRVVGAAGIAGYVRQKDEWLLDHHGLTDPFLARVPAIKTDWWRAGHGVHLIPPGYQQSLSREENMMVLGPEQEFYDRLRLVTRGELWTWARWKAIWELNLHPSSGLDLEKYRNGWVQLPMGDKQELPIGKFNSQGWESLQIKWDKAWLPPAFELGLDQSASLIFKLDGKVLDSQSLYPAADDMDSLTMHTIPRLDSSKFSGIDELVIRPSGFSSGLTGEMR
jgi:arabinofuranosyltransferase